MVFLTFYKLSTENTVPTVNVFIVNFKHEVTLRIFINVLSIKLNSRCGKCTKSFYDRYNKRFSKVILLFYFRHTLECYKISEIKI